MGEQRQTKDGKSYPAKLETWRLTSPVRDLLDAAATLYGGEVAEWSEPKSNDRFELITTTDTLDIVLPPGDFAFSQWYEMWSGGGCQRRCDGCTEQLTDEACLCPTDAEERAKMAKDGKACKITSRLNVVLPHVPDIGIWQLETHGYYSATELPGSLDIIRMASGGTNLIEARLRLEQRSAKREGSTLRYAVPVIELPTLSAGALMTGEAPARAIEAPRPALEASREAPKQETPAPPTARAQRRTPEQPPLPGEDGLPVAGRPATKAAPTKKAPARKAAPPRNQGSVAGGPFDDEQKTDGAPPWSKSLHTYAAEVAKPNDFDAALLLGAVIGNVLGDPTKRSTKDVPDQATANKAMRWLRDIQQGAVDIAIAVDDSGESYTLVVGQKAS